MRIHLPSDPQSVKKLLIKIVIGIALLYVCYVVRPIWVPFGLAFLLAMILDPVVDRMERRGWKRPRASAFIFGSFLIIAAGLLTLAYPFVVGEAITLQKGFENHFPNPSRAGIIASLRHMGLSPFFANTGASSFESAKTSLEHSSGWLTDYGMSIASNAIWIVIVPIVAFYALRDFHIILAKGLLLVPPKRRDLVQTAVGEVTGVFGKYLRALAIVSVLNGAATTVLLACIRVPGALLLGIVAGLFYTVPYIGALLTIVLTAIVAFVGGGPYMALLAVGLSVVLHQIVFDQIVSPRILGGQVGLHPIISIFALLVGNLLLGIIGMILAVPVAACIQIAILAVVPKLSKEIEVTVPEDSDTVESLEAEIEEEHTKVDATAEMHAAVTAAVDQIEQSVEEEKNEPDE